MQRVYFMIYLAVEFVKSRLNHNIFAAMTKASFSCSIEVGEKNGCQSR